MGIGESEIPQQSYILLVSLYNKKFMHQKCLPVITWGRHWFVYFPFYQMYDDGYDMQLIICAHNNLT